MNAERALVSKVAQTGKGAVELATEGIIDEHFIEDDCLEVWRFILSHEQRYGKQPTVPTLLEEFPSFSFELSEEPLSYIRDRFIEGVERRHTIDFLQELAVASNDPDKAGELANMILEKGRGLKQILPEKGVAKLSDAKMRIADYEARAASGTQYTGTTIGIPEIDDATLGIQSHELVAIVGWQGTGKSTLAQWILTNFYTQGKRGLYISLEMTAEALLRKWDAMFQKFQSYRHLKMLNLSDAEVARWKKWAEGVEDAKQDIIVVADGGSWTPDRVHGEIVKHKPDVVVVDYLTLMYASMDRNEERWVTLTALSRALKQVAIQTNTPIIIINQTNRDSAKDGAELSNIGGSYAIGADSDIVIGLHQDDDMREYKQMEVRLIKNRDGDIVKSTIYWDMATMTFADSFMLEQARQLKAKHELEQVTTGNGNGDGRKEKLRAKLGQAAASIAGESRPSYSIDLKEAAEAVAARTGANVEAGSVDFGILEGRDAPDKIGVPAEMAGRKWRPDFEWTPLVLEGPDPGWDAYDPATETFLDIKASAHSDAHLLIPDNQLDPEGMAKKGIDRYVLAIVKEGNVTFAGWLTRDEFNEKAAYKCETCGKKPQSGRWVHQSELNGMEKWDAERRDDAAQTATG